MMPPPFARPLGSSEALYTDSTVALAPATGKLAWYHQHLARDVWYMDEALARVPIKPSSG
jgi:alcohol dehydrogenase (cytochrome c)